MQQELKEKFPKWCFEDKPLATTLTNDIDSLLGCTIEQLVKGNEIHYFYDFDNVYRVSNSRKLPTLGIDLAFTNGKCWDNHVTRLHKNSKINPQSANINSILNISGDNYYDKYAGSTTLLMWSFYGLPLPQSKLGKMILLGIDSEFLGHYDNRYKKVHNKYLSMLGFDELIDILNDTTKKDYFDLLRKYKLNEKNGGKIFIDEKGFLQTNLPLSQLSEVLELQLELPRQSFTLLNSFESKHGAVKGNESGELKRNVISFALTNKKFYKYTVKDTKEKIK